MWIRLVLLCHTVANIKFKACKLRLGRQSSVFLQDHELRCCARFGVLTGRFGPTTPGRFGPAHTSRFNSVMGQGVSNADLNTKQFDWIPHWAAWSISSRAPQTLRSFETEVSVIQSVSQHFLYVEKWMFSFFWVQKFRRNFLSSENWHAVTGWWPQSIKTDISLNALFDKYFLSCVVEYWTTILHLNTKIFLSNFKECDWFYPNKSVAKWPPWSGLMTAYAVPGFLESSR